MFYITKLIKWCYPFCSLALGRIHQIYRFYIISWDFWSSHKISQSLATFRVPLKYILPNPSLSLPNWAIWTQQKQTRKVSRNSNRFPDMLIPKSSSLCLKSAPTRQDLCYSESECCQSLKTQFLSELTTIFVVYESPATERDTGHVDKPLVISSA